MAFESLFARPPSSGLLDTHMTECQHAGDERTEAELEDGEIEDGGVEEEPEPEEEKKEEIKEEEEKTSSEKTHKKSRKRKKKDREKKKRRRREKHKHSDSSESYDSDGEHPERPHKPPMYRDYDAHYSPHAHYASHKKSRPGYDDFSNYSDGNFNEEEEEDYAEQLKHYRQSKESPTIENPPFKKGIKGAADSGGEQQQKGYFYGRGAGPHKKMIRKDRGRGRGGHKGSYYQDGFQEDHKSMKKWVTMSQEFINQHTVERNGKQICKYFLERRCVKGDQCKFDHDAEIEKKKEICKFYIQGYCTRGDNCIYMHNEFPCKFFHTGAKCYQGDNCKFSHDTLTEDSRELLNKVLNTEEEELLEEEESEEMSQHGGNYYNQPYMGMPFTGNHPSMYNSEPLPEPGPMTSPPQSMPVYGNQGMNAPFNQCAAQSHGPNHQRDGPPGPPFLQAAEENTHGMPLQNSYQHSQNAPAYYDNYYSQQAVQHAPSSSNISESVRKVLFSRIGKSMDGAESNQPPAPQRSLSRDEDEFANWYSSEEEDGVSSILKTLRNQAKLARTNSAEQKPVPQNNDPRLAKDRTGGGQVFDPRVRPSQGQSPSHQGENVSPDPRVVRDPRKVKPHEPPAISQPVHSGGNNHKQRKVVDEDDEDAERELREKAAVIPLERMPGVTLRDPRLKLRQFSHIKMDIILSKPHFAKLIVWAPEDLLPVPPPKPDPVSSINLPLPPLIADQRLNKSRGLGEVHHSGHDPRLERLDPRLESKAKQANIASRSSFGDPSESHIKPSDPRLQKSLQSRFHRSPSSDTQLGSVRDSLPPKVDPRLVPRSAMGSSPTSVKPPQDVLLPYTKVSPSSSRLGSPGSILKNISLYNPRNSATTAPEPLATATEQNGDHHKKDSENKPSAEPEEVDIVQKPPSPSEEQPKAKDAESAGETEIKPNDPEEKPEESEKPAVTQPSAAPAVHNLPIQALSGLIRPQYNDPRQVKPAGPPSQASDTNPEGEPDDKPLKDVFKTFDPTASPFC